MEKVSTTVNIRESLGISSSLGKTLTGFAGRVLEVFSRQEGRTTVRNAVIAAIFVILVGSCAAFELVKWDNKAREAYPGGMAPPPTPLPALIQR